MFPAFFEACLQKVNRFIDPPHRSLTDRFHMSYSQIELLFDYKTATHSESYYRSIWGGVYRRGLSQLQVSVLKTEPII